MRLRAVLSVAAVVGAVMSTPAVEAQASTAVTTASYTITPNPIAAAGSLSPTTSVTLTLTAYSSSGAVEPNVTVWLSPVAWNHDGHWIRNGGYVTLRVESALLNTHYFGSPVYEYRVDGAGQLTMTFMAGDPGKVGGQAGVFAEPTGHNGKGAPCLPGCQALYQYAS